MEREKVINGILQHCEGSMFDRCGECPYYEVGHEPFVCRDMLLNDLNDMLKEQEAVEPIPYHRSDGTIFKYECRKCRTKIFKMDLFCRHCGRSVKWE